MPVGGNLTCPNGQARLAGFELENHSGTIIPRGGGVIWRYRMYLRKKGILLLVVIFFFAAGCTPAAQQSTAVPTQSATEAIPFTAPEPLNTPPALLVEPTAVDSASAGLNPTPESSAAAATQEQSAPSSAAGYDLQAYPVPAGTHPHDVAPDPQGGVVWYTAQATGGLGRLDPETGETHHIPLGSGSSPHGVIVGPDGAPWITDSGLNAIVRVDPVTEEVQVFPLPAEFPRANLNTATFDLQGVLWFTGQSGVYGSLDPNHGAVEAFQAPDGRGPYGIATTPSGDVYFVSLAGSYLARIDPVSGQAAVFEPPTPNQGARRVWSDSQGRLWVSEWSAGQLARYDPASDTWQEWKLPGDRPQPYSVYVDDQDMVWVSDFGANAMVRFDPVHETFDTIPLPRSPANVRQMLGRPSEVWGAESGTDHLIVIRTR